MDEQIEGSSRRRRWVWPIRIAGGLLVCAGIAVWILLLGRWVGSLGMAIGFALNLGLGWIDRRLQRPRWGPVAGRRPICSRCGGDMRGREEGRTCPGCGAMYGVEYVE